METNAIKYNNVIDFNVDNETIWATSDKIALLFSCTVDNVYLHVKNILNEGELTEESSVKGLRNKLYNLDMIIAVGYRVNSKKATTFRQWATKVLSQYIKDGYVIDEKRLAQDPSKLNELAAKIRELRANEKNIYQAVRDCFKISATDYNKDSKEAKSFYALLQDKFHFAITGLTASKLILDRADHRLENMGIQSSKNIFPTLSEASIGKSYVLPNELYRMHLLSEQWLLYAESIALRERKLTMHELHKKLDELLEFNEYPVFEGYKTYLVDEAKEHAKNEFALYEKIQKLKYSNIDVDLELFYNGGYDDLSEELELEKKDLFSIYQKYTEEQQVKIELNINLNSDNPNFETAMDKIASTIKVKA